MLFLPASLDDDGVAQIDTSASANGFVAGIAYDDSALALGDVGAVAASDRFVRGFRITADGKVRIFDATAGLPLKYTFNQGVAMTTNGQVCYTTDAFSALDAAYVAGLAITLDGRIYANVN